MGTDRPRVPPGRWLLAGSRPLWHLVSRYPLLLLPTLAVLALLWDALPEGFDATHVLWADGKGAALGRTAAVPIGLAVGGLMAAVLAGVWWLDRRRPAPPGQPPREPNGDEYVAGWVLLCLAAVAPTAVRGGLFPTRVDGVPVDPADLVSGVHPARLRLPLGVALALLVGLIGYARSDDIAHRTRRWLGWGSAVVVAGGYVVMGLIHWAGPTFYFEQVGAGLTGLLFFGLGVAVATLVHWAGQTAELRPYFYPVTGGLVLAAVLAGGLVEPEHRVPGLDGYYAGRAKLLDYADSPRHPAGATSDTDALEAWARLHSPRRPDGTRDPVVLVTVSGGASTSAVFVARSLFQLEARFPGFVDRVRIVSGASGGMLGAAHFVAQFRPGSPYRRENRAKTSPVFREYVRRLEEGTPPGRDDPAGQAYWDEVDTLEPAFIAGLEADFLGPLFQKWVHKDLNPLSGLFPRATTNDRGTALEAAWDRTLLGRPADGSASWDTTLPALGVPFADLGPDERAGKLPSLVFTPMMVEDGRQIIISNLDLDFMTDWGSHVPTDTFPEWSVSSYSAVEFYRLFPGAAKTFRLGTAVRLNASFPLLSPAAELPTDPPRRVVDAGYYDNYGLIVASRWVEQHAEWLVTNDVPVWVLQLWTYGYDELSTHLVTPAEAARVRAGKSAVDPLALRSSTAPLQGLFAAWRANMAYRGEERLNLILEEINRARYRAKRPLLASRFRHDIGEADLPMNWVLTGYERAQIQRAVREAQLVGRGARESATKTGAEVVRQPDVRKQLQELRPGAPADRPAVKEMAELAGRLYKLSEKPAAGK